MENSEQFTKNLPTASGVYCMFNQAGDVIYVGKAKNLKNRVSSYFSGSKDIKTRQLVGHIHDIQVTITKNEVEASLLELQLIQQLKPKYNIIFKDDKSYPYIWLDTREEYPRLTFYRGNAKEPGEFFGPYPSAKEVRETLDLLQQIFTLRQCDKTFFANRTRPCLQYQIKRCSAPCVGLIEKERYLADLRNARLFLTGKSKQVVNYLLQEMDSAAKNLDYERAATVRDQLAALRKTQQQQTIVEPNFAGNVDVLGVASAGSQACIHMLSIRAGSILGSKQYWLNTNKAVDGDSDAILQAFISQNYLGCNYNRDIDNQQTLRYLPEEIIIPFALKEQQILEEVIMLQTGGKIKIIAQSQLENAKANRAEWLNMAQRSVEQAIYSRTNTKHAMRQRFQGLASALGVQQEIQRIECFDISHTLGEATIGACVVFGQDGPIRADYRRYNIQHAKAGDDYAALREATTRHYIKLKTAGLPLPDLLLIDGGKGQLSVCQEVVRTLQLPGIILLGVAKGVTRKPGLETLFLNTDGLTLELATDSPALHLIQQIRDEAHNLAITSHRAKRDKKRLRSILEDIPGIGAKRRHDLLARFGGLAELKQAQSSMIEQVPGISKILAKRIYDALHMDGV